MSADYCVYKHVDATGKLVYIGFGKGNRPASTGQTRGGTRMNPRTVTHGAMVDDAVQNHRCWWRILLKNLEKEDAYEIEQLLIDMCLPDYNISHKERSRNMVNLPFEVKSARVRGKKWYTDGTVNKRLFECPTGWKPGRSNFTYRKSYETRT